MQTDRQTNFLRKANKQTYIVVYRVDPQIKVIDFPLSGNMNNRGTFKTSNKVPLVATREV